MKNILTLFALFFVFSAYNQKTYKALMDDPFVNFYEVCKEADKYFEKHDKNVKGSGWKGYQRWRNENESKYAPSGRRDNVDPYFVSNQYKAILKSTRANSSRSLYNNGWKDLGPYRIDSITGQYSVGLGRVVASYVHRANPQIMYIGSRSGGFWKSTDGGANWSGKSTDTLFASGVGTIIASPTNADSILIGVQNATNNYSHGIYRSADQGDTWIETNFNPTNLGKGGLGSAWRINKIAYHPRVPNLIFIAASDGLYRSDDNLSTWTKITNGSISQIDFHPSNNNIIYIYDYYSPNGNKDKVLRSLDQGLTFVASATIAGNSSSTGYFSVSNDCNDCMYFASTNGVWKSIDTAKTFTFLSNPPQSCLGFAVNDLDTSKMVYGYVDVETTSDGGKTFSQSTWWNLGVAQNGTGDYMNRLLNGNKYIHADLHPAISVNGVYYVGTDGFFCKSVDNGTTWNVIGQGVGMREFYSLGASQSNHYRSIAGSQDNGTSIKHETTWIEFNGGDGMEGIIHPLNDDWKIGSFQYGSRFRTKNGGQSNQGVSPSGNSGQGNADWEAPLFYNPNNHMEIYHFSDSVFKGSDFGDSWVNMGSPSFTGNIYEATVAENNSDIIIVARGSAIEKSIDGGQTFVDIKNTLPGYTIKDIAFDPNDDETIIVVYDRYLNDGNKVFVTYDGGTTWNNITYNLGSMPLKTVVIDKTNASNIYVGAEIGVYTMPIGGSNWLLHNTNLPNVTVKELEIVNGSNTLRAATWGRGLWEFSLVGRENYPAIVKTAITNMPTESLPKETVEQFVTSKISYTSGTLTSVFVRWSVDSLSFDSLTTMSNIGDSTWKSNGPLPLADSGQKVYFKVYAVGNLNDTTETYKFMYELKEFKYCVAAGSSVSGNLYVNEFNVSNINNTSANDSITYYADSVIYLVKDSSYNVYMETNTGWASNDHAAWIDYNGDANFSEDEEVLYSINNGSSSSNIFTVPSSAKANDTLLLRARVSYWSNTTIDPCGITLGEVEEYPVYIIETPSLTYSLSDSTLCLGSDLNYSYTGDAVDSLTWTISNGINVYNSTNLNDVVTSIPVGIYSVSIEGYLKGFSFIKTYSTALEVKSNAINTSVTDGGISLTANQTGVLYQWLDCGASLSQIGGATSQTYSPASPGVFAVALNNNYCIDTSSCYTVATVSLENNQLNTTIKVYPNPAKEDLTIAFGKQINEGVLKIIDESGKTVLINVIKASNKIDLNISNLAAGIYFVEVYEGEVKATVKILKK